MKSRSSFSPSKSFPITYVEPRQAAMNRAASAAISAGTVCGPSNSLYVTAYPSPRSAGTNRRLHASMFRMPSRVPCDTKIDGFPR